GANFASVAVRIRLRFRQRALASGPQMNTAVEPAGAQSLLDLARAIGAVAEHVRHVLPLVKSSSQLLAVVHRRIGPLVARISLCLASAFTWFLYPKKLLPCLFVRRASRSFWRNCALLRYSTGLHRPPREAAGHRKICGRAMWEGNSTAKFLSTAGANSNVETERRAARSERADGL